MWKIGREMTRLIFQSEPGVVKIRMGKKRKHTTMVVPSSVIERVHRRLSGE